MGILNVGTAQGFKIPTKGTNMTKLVIHNALFSQSLSCMSIYVFHLTGKISLETSIHDSKLQIYVMI